MPRQRRAYTCPKCEKAGAPRRIFLAPDEKAPPSCPEHGRCMVAQPNVPYRRSTVQPLR